MAQILKSIKFPAELLEKINAAKVVDGRKSFSDAAKRLIELGLASLEKKEK